MKLNDVERAMRAGEFGPVAQAAIEHQVQVGDFFGAEDFVEVTQAHVMADTESLGEEGVRWLESLSALEPKARVRVPTITDPRGTDFAKASVLNQPSKVLGLERRTIAAFEKLGVSMTDTCINYQTVQAPTRGEPVAFGDTGVVIYTNSILGARSNYEGGPSALSAGLTGRTPRYGFHLDAQRRATVRIRAEWTPKTLNEWGALGAVVGRIAGNYWAVPVVEGLEGSPGSDAMKHFGAAMASFGSIAMFHLVGITPEAVRLEDCGGDKLPVAKRVTESDVRALIAMFHLVGITPEAVRLEDCGGDKLPVAKRVTEADVRALIASYPAGGEIDVVVFSAPQLSLYELRMLADLCDGRKFVKPLLAVTSPQVKPDSDRMGYTAKIEGAGGHVMSGMCFYQSYAREIAEANGWKRLATNSTKIVNILGGYGYTPMLASMEQCVEAAVKGRLS